MSDQHRWDVSGFYGNPVVKTPVLDQLARTGVVFDNAYTPSPICVPARQCISAGMLPSSCDCTRWGDDLPPFSRTYARVFSEHAYSTAVCGKLHHDGMDQNQGWRLRIGWDNQIDPKFMPGIHREEFAPYAAQARSQWWPWSKEVARAGIGKSPHLARDQMAVWGACELIEEHFASPYYDHESRQPMLLKVSLRLPHYPFLTGEDLFNYYLNRVPCHTGDPVFEHPVLGRDPVQPGVDVSEREIRRATAAYYGMVETMDGMYGRVLDKLRQVGQDPDDWIIVYMSDHGEMLGEHGVWMKYKFFEGSVKVPLVIRWPKQFAGNRRISGNVSLCDLYATLCDLAGIEAPPGLDSRSLVPLLAGKKAELTGDEVVSQLNDTIMIKRGALKYQYYGEDIPEVLFDLERDPGEKKNWISDGAYQDELSVFRKKARQIARHQETPGAVTASV
jgi:choline-sulfatase